MTGSSVPHLFVLKGDKTRRFFGSGVLPYHRWHKSKRVDVLDDRIIVPIAAGRAFKFVRGEAAFAHHPLAPEKIGEKPVQREGPKCLMKVLTLSCPL